MAVAGRHGIAPFLMAIMIGHGGLAGAFSPIAVTGIVVNATAARMGITGVQWPVYLNLLAVHAAVGFAGYLALGGFTLLTRREAATPAFAPVSPASGFLLDSVALESPARTDVTREGAGQPLRASHVLTLLLVCGLVIAVVAGIDVGMASFVCALILTITRAADDSLAIQQMPWKVILMVTGMTMLVGLLEKTGGLDLFSTLLARMATPATSTLVTAFFTGLISIYSSTTGVVLPALLPTIPSLIEQMGGGDPLALVTSMSSGGSLVDVSPLSTVGALCVAAAPVGTDTRQLFNQLMAWGLSMAVVGAVSCWMLYGVQ